MFRDVDDGSPGEACLCCICRPHSPVRLRPLSIFSAKLC